MSGINPRTSALRRFGALGSALLAIVLFASACDPTEAQRVQLPIGNSTNYLGTGNLWSGPDRENRWLAISGVCASREQGDRFSPISDGNFTTNNNPPSGNNSFGGCAPGVPAYVEPNPEHRPGGYVYAFEVPEDHQGSLSFQVYDAPNCVSSPAGDSSARFPVDYTVYGDEGAGMTMLASVRVAPDDAGCGIWSEVHAMADPPSGTYLLQVQAVPPPDLAAAAQEGSNSFALRAVSGGTWNRCTSDPRRATPDTSFTEGCVSISAVGGAGMLVNFASTTASIPLRVDAMHSGGMLEIELWDIGEGSRSLQILGPDLVARTFRWTVLCLDGSEPTGGSCAGESNPSGGRSGVTSLLDVRGSNHPQPRAHRLSSSRYNDRLLRLEVDLPYDLGAEFGDGDVWWIQIAADSAASDRTTISAFVRSGD